MKLDLVVEAPVWASQGFMAGFSHSKIFHPTKDKIVKIKLKISRRQILYTLKRNNSPFLSVLPILHLGAPKYPGAAGMRHMPMLLSTQHINLPTKKGR
jgi:hypothetical protein